MNAQPEPSTELPVAQKDMPRAHQEHHSERSGLQQWDCVTPRTSFALSVVADLAGHGVAQDIQRQMEYDPEPPYRTGSPRTAPPALVNATREKIASFVEHRRNATQRAAERLARLPAV